MSINSSSSIINQNKLLIGGLQNEVSKLNADKSKTSSNLTAVKNSSEFITISEKYTILNDCFQDLDASISDIKDKINAESACLNIHVSNKKNISLTKGEVSKELDRVSNFDDSKALRMKNNSVKTVNTSLFKNLLNGKRYAEEAKYFVSKFQTNKVQGIKEKLNNELAHLDRKSNELESAIKSGNEDIKTLSVKLVGIEAEQSNLLDNNFETVKKWVDIRTHKIEPLENKIIKIDEEINSLNKSIELSNKTIEAESKLIEKERSKRVKEFCTIYQSNSGCKSMNETARAIFGNGGKITPIDHKAVYNEYYRCCEDQLRPSEWRTKKTELSYLCKGNIKTVVSNIAEDIYQPSKNEIITYRGQGITNAGFEKIKSDLKDASTRNKRPIYNAGQFFSTAVNKDLAESFSVAHRGKNETAIMFEIKGNSSTTMHADHDLQFNIGRDNEEIYSPLASFMVTKIVGNTIYLSECDRRDKGISLPY